MDMADVDGPAALAGERPPQPREIELTDGVGASLAIAQQFHGTTGPQVWDAGIVLLRFLATAPLAKVLATHPRVVELGSGTGVVGIAAAALGGDLSRVTSTLDVWACGRPRVLAPGEGAAPW